tara:strand:- start:690 stop:1307 length:618 start_codon:yes stop_codon:yes gene_type:complete
MNEGIVYVLTNPAMPGMVKIGKTGRQVETRLSDLYSTGVPLPFECEYAARVTDMDKVEKAFHQAFGPNRVNPKREFFDIEPEQAIAVLELMAIEDMTPTIKEKAENVDLEAKSSIEKFKQQRLPPAHFFEMGLKIGDTLTFQYDEISCKVHDDRKVEYLGETYYLTGLTQKLLNTEKKLRGTKYWFFEGKNLVDIYKETYSYLLN